MSKSDGGWTDLVRPLYDNLLRPHLPRKWGVINGVAVRDFRLLDQQDTQTERMAGLLDAIEDVVDVGDTVVDIATGRGVAAVTAARAGAESVHSYEASGEMVAVSEETLQASRVGSRVDVTHAVVGEPKDVWGTPDGAATIPPSDLPDVDVLQLDCEGAELSILDGLEQRPPTVVVETHPTFGAPTQESRAALWDMGYHVETRAYEAAKPEKDVLVGRRSQCGNERDSEVRLA